MATCCATLRVGTICTKPAHYMCYGKWYCGRHKKKDNVLAEYGPEGLILSNIDFGLADDDPIAESNIEKLNGYINIKVGWPVFTNGESSPLALISKISHDTETFTRITLAQELKAAIEYFLSRPDAYNLSGYSLDELRLDRITYDPMYGIFIANISTV